MSRRLELAALVGLAFFLPLYEAPKSIFWALYVVVWLTNRVRARDFGGRWSGWDTLIAVWIASGFLVAAFAGAHGDEWRGALDLVRYGSVLWLVKRSGYTGHELRRIVGALVVSTLVGLGMAYVVLSQGEVEGLQLNSVGHPNHTAIYIAIMLGLCTSWVFAAWREWSAAGRILAAVTLVALVAGLVHSASRGAIAVGFLAVVVLALAWWKRSRVPFVATAGALVVTAAAMAAGGAEVLRKHEAYKQADIAYSLRGEIWAIALGTWREYPWFGVGMDNFSRLTPYRERLAKEAESNRALRNAIRFGSHGHSLYFNTLAERGTIGAVVLAAVLAALAVALARRRPAPSASAEEWLLWGGAVAALVVTLGVGLVNTTLHHEHGLLAALLVGLWLGKQRRRGA